jgi:hypothetical protein
LTILDGVIGEKVVEIFSGENVVVDVESVKGVKGVPNLLPDRGDDSNMRADFGGTSGPVSLCSLNLLRTL